MEKRGEGGREGENKMERTVRKNAIHQTRTKVRPPSHELILVLDCGSIGDENLVSNAYQHFERSKIGQNIRHGGDGLTVTPVLRVIKNRISNLIGLKLEAGETHVPFHQKKA